MPPRPAFDVFHIPCRGHQIQKIDDIQRGRAPERKMVQPRSDAIGKGHVMHAAFPVHPCCPKLLALRIFGVFRYAKAKITVKGHRRIHIRAETIEVINAKRFYAFVKRIVLMDRREAVHLVVKLNGNAQIVRGQKCFALIGPFHPRGGPPFGFEIAFGAIKVCLVISFKTQHIDRSGGG